MSELGPNMNHIPWHICVLIPARDEEILLPRCLASVLAACAALPQGVTYDIVVAADSSTDNTLAIAQQFLHAYGAVVSTSAGVVGCARALAAQVALARYSGPLDRCWLANTDADCAVPEAWLADQLALARGDVEAIAGIIDVDTFAEHGPAVPSRFHSSYVIYPDGSHPHVHGANLGVRADAYQRAGGWAPLSTAEDHDLWRRLASSGSRSRSIGRMKVLTSGRRLGRAPHGFAAALASHNEAALITP